MIPEFKHTHFDNGNSFLGNLGLWTHALVLAREAREHKEAHEICRVIHYAMEKWNRLHGTGVNSGLERTQTGGAQA